jgi:hypothetical protein
MVVGSTVTGKRSPWNLIGSNRSTLISGGKACMTEFDTNEEPVAVHVEKNGTGPENAPDPDQSDSAVNSLWDLEDNWNSSQKEELITPDNLKFELETLTIEKARLQKENKRLADMLESIKLEEDIALLKEEVSILGGEHEQLVVEIQRRRQSMTKNVPDSDIPNFRN